MSKIFLTGDRSLAGAYVPLVAIELLRAVNAGDEIATGENGGVEHMIRDMAERAGVSVEVVPGGKPEFDQRHAFVAEQGYRAVVIHADPHASSMYPSLLAAFADQGDDAVTLVGLESLV